MLELEQRLLARETAAVAGERAVLADDSVAGDDDGHGRLPDTRTHRANEVGPADAACELRIADRRAVRNLEQPLPDGQLELRADEVERDVERPPLAREVLLELRQDRRERVGIAKRPVRPVSTTGERDLRHASRSCGDGQRAEWALVDVPPGGFGRARALGRRTHGRHAPLVSHSRQGRRRARRPRCEMRMG